VVFARTVDVYQQKRKEYSQLQQQIQSLQQQNGAMEQQIKLSRQTPKPLKKKRVSGRYARPGEFVYTLAKTQPPSSSDKK